MRNSLSQSLKLAPENIIIKQRERQRGGAGQGGRRSQYEKLASRGLIREIREGNCKFKVNLSDYLDTGLFLDRRGLRKMVEADAKGKKVLNLFCYTASFSVCAALGGAVSTDSVDLSNTYLAWARDNFALNGLDAANSVYADSDTPAHRLIRADVSAFLDHALAARRANEARYKWDSIILDPPAFSNSAMARADFDLSKDHPALLAKCLALLSTGGKLWFSASAKSFRAGAGELEMTLNGAKAADITDKIVDEDFKGKKMPKTFVITGTGDRSLFPIP